MQCAGAVIAALLPAIAVAQADPAAAVLDPVVVTATRRAERSFDVPAAVDSIDGATLRDGQPAINLSETLVRVPGIFGAHRNNIANVGHVGPVIVGDTNGRYYEPAPGRNWMAGVGVTASC